MALLLSDFGLGQVDQTGACGPRPGTGPGETAVCCPNIGWIVYDSFESPYGICERAAAQSGGTYEDEPLPEDPLERAAERRRRLEERRAAFEEERHRADLEKLQLKFALSRVAAAQAAQASAAAAERSSEAAARKAKADAARMKSLTTVAAVGGGIYLLAKALKFL